jgi:hypothetical protein
VLTIVNDGRGSARAPYLAVSPGAHYGISAHGIDGNGAQGLLRYATADPKWVAFTDGNVVIPPGARHAVTAIGLLTSVNHQQTVFLRPDLTIQYHLGAEGSGLQSDNITITGRQIAMTVLPADLVEKIPPGAA